MPRNPAGELSLNEIRNLVRQHNRLTTIKGVDTKSRKQLLQEISDMGYKVDHSKKKIVRITAKGLSKIEVSQGGEKKMQKRTKLKKLKEGGGGVADPVMGGQDLADRQLIARRKAKQAKAKRLYQLKTGHPDIPKKKK
jgi:hypothetical protein